MKIEFSILKKISQMKENDTFISPIIIRQFFFNILKLKH